MVLFDRDFSLCSEDRQPALTRPEGGAFLAFVLLEAPAWDPDQFRRDLRDRVRHPLPHRGGGMLKTAAAP